MAYERISPADASLLHLESPRVPMHVGAVAVFEGDPFRDADGRFRIEDVRRFVEGRLQLVPRYRRRLRSVPLRQGRPVWVDDERFDIGYHVRLTALPRPGDDQQLLALAARLQSHQLDRSRPLWELWFVEGLAGGRVAVVSKSHHVLTDPAGGPDLASALLSSDVGVPAPPRPAPSDADHAPGPVRLLALSVAQRFTDPAEVARSVRAALRGPRRAAGAALATTRVLGRIGRAATRLPFNGAIGPHRRIATVRFPVERVAAIRERAGANLDEVVLATVTGALRTYLDAGGHTLDGVTIRSLVPHLRGDRAAALDLRLDGTVVELPVSEVDPLARVRAIAAQRAGDDAAAGAGELLAIAGLGPPAVVGLAGRLLPYQRAVNLAVAAVDGPRAPVHLFGARMLEAFPYVGPVDGMALVVTAFAYADQLTFALCADRDAVPDLRVFADGLERAVDELERASSTTGTRP